MLEFLEVPTATLIGYHGYQVYSLQNMVVKASEHVAYLHEEIDV